MSYPGGKSMAGVYHRLINLMPPHETYIEPFLGGGALLLAKRPARLNIGVELNRDVAREWQRRDLVESLEMTALAGPVGNGDSAGGIAGNGDASGKSAATLKMTAAAAAVSFGDGRRQRIQPSDLAAAAAVAGNGGADRAVRTSGNRSHVASSSDRRRRVSPFPATADPDAARFQFLHGDGLAFLQTYSFTGTELVYCDPPYLMSTRSSGRLYAHEMSDGQHRDLLQTIKRLPCMVMISGYRSPMYSAALEDWNSIRYEAMTRGGLAEEWCWYNFDRPLALHDYRYLGVDRRDREQLKRKKQRWTSALEGMPELERQVLLCSITSDRRERERIKRKRERWTARINRMPLLERQALLAAIASVAGNGDGRPPLETLAAATAGRNGGGGL